MSIETIGRQYRFRVYYTDSDGYRKQYNSRKYDDKKTCKEDEAKFILANDNPDKVNFHTVSLNYFDYVSKIRKESTVYTYKKDYNRYLKPFFEKMYINSIDIQIVRRWAEKIESAPISVAYKNKLYNILKNIFDYAIKNHGLKSNPVKDYGRFQERTDKVIKDEDKIKYITLDEFNKFISVVDDISWKTFFVFLYYTGCRRGEVQALKISDIDFNKKEISINKTLYEEVKGKVLITSTKNNKNRKIKMSNTLIEQLKEYLTFLKNTYRDYNDSWYLFGCEKYFPKSTIARKKHQYFKKSGVSEITIHQFRHSHVSLLINEYIKSGQTDTAKFFIMMSDRMGHTIQVMQDTYMHLFPTVQDEIIDLLDRL